MIDWGQFHFLRPAWFLALAPLAALLWLQLRRRSGSRWEGVCDPVLLPFILLGDHSIPRRFAWMAVLAGGLLAITALAGPTWSRLPQPVFSSQSALVIALDLSRSMDANDLRPSRLARARFKIADLLRQRREGQTALLVYAGDAYTVAPLTDDGATLLSQLPAVTTDIMPAPGNRTELALERAGELLRQAGRSHGDVLLITDEVDGDRAEQSARGLASDGFRVSVLGVGSEQGAPIALAQGGFLKDSRGEIVIARLAEAPLRGLARAGGGDYARLSVDDSDLDALSRRFAASTNALDAVSTELRTDAWEEQGPWLLLALLPLAALAFRRGYVAVLLLAFLPLPRPANAFDWDGLWLRADQLGKRALESGNPGRAAELFRDPDWKGAAHYRAGEFDAAASALGGAERLDSLYNRGNALARLGRYAEAIAAYDEVLKRDPGIADARSNKALVEQALQRLKQQQQQQQQPGQAGQDGQPQAQPSQQSEQGQAGQGRPGKEQGGQQQPGDGETEQAREGGDAQDSSEDPGAQAGQQDGQTPPDAGAGALRPVPDEGDPATGEERAAGLDRDDRGEERQAAEQWLRRIPDDPGGLLRRKFLYQYRQRHASSGPAEKTW